MVGRGRRWAATAVRVAARAGSLPWPGPGRFAARARTGQGTQIRAGTSGASAIRRAASSSVVTFSAARRAATWAR